MSAEELTTKLTRLLEELKDNREHAEHQYQVTNQGKLVTRAWDAVKDEVGQG